MTPNADKRNFFYGVNFEFSYQTSRFAETRHAFEIRPIIGARNKEWEFIVNPIVDLSFGSLGEADFVPAARLARKLGNDRLSASNTIRTWARSEVSCRCRSSRTSCFAVTDFKLGELDVNFGIGYGLTSGSDRLVTKAIFCYAFPVPGGGKEANGGALKRLPATRSFSAPMVPDGIAAMR